MSTWMMFMFQESNSLYADNLVSFHNMVMMIVIMISTLTVYIIFDLFLNKFSNLYLLKNHNIEIIWTIVPIVILLIICFPSLKILYLIDEIVNPFFSIKSIGHQWYWSYEYPEFNNIEFDSYMLNYSDLNQFRLLETDNRMIIPMKIPLRLITTSTDVIHSWTVPSLGIKVDAVPGRINQLNLISKRPGIFFGQCSEICGMNHSFMPIMVESTSFKYFMNWIYKMN
uniref:Cytochrome c oxidase subunit 2 n=1 Tax=Apis andreniformis TaxID=7464 RepID=H9X7T8_9HYME|nr:cytochrome c oxidase subunit II [Apis andreniformis]AAU01005.1 cytochrome oxidase subunit II [Apis andreniformis]AFG70331.1 cytochrome oxidase subunit 2 [Apis andreniformis]AGI56717.1 cytochrome c oxidase subunit II [Apis andreniformis]BBC54796.1 cytochrome oxidase subunit 2 [Apis andreniformis]